LIGIAYVETEAANVEVWDLPASLNMRAVAALAALGQPTRLSMFRQLVSREPHGMTAGEIAQAMHCPQNTASGHLAILARAQLVHSARNGRSVVYRVDLGGVRRLVEYLLADCCNCDPSACADIFAGICETACSDPASKKPGR
jgi:DNA-binding transcriptional ArsR family regulator